MAQAHVSSGTTTAVPDKRRMSQSQEPALPRKRRRTEDDPSKTADKPTKKPATTETPSMAPLSSVQEAVLEDLKPKYDVLPAFTISATKVAKRNVRILEHLRKDNGDPRPRVVYLHARPSDANKMITIVEQVKRELAKEGKTGGGRWFQYNMLYELPSSLSAKKTGPSTTAKDAEDAAEPASDDDDDFERMESRHRLDKAVDAEPMPRAQMSLGIFLAQVPISELKGRADVTTQSNVAEVAA